jgi:hypothetical protein
VQHSEVNVATGLPTLSQIQAWDVDHLIEAADHWNSTAECWDSVYGRVWQESLGMDWQGQARDALIDRTTTDRTTVAQRSDQLREAAVTARTGASEISAIQRAVLYQVDDAHQAGFVVGEDLSVTDTRTSPNAAVLTARQAEAQALSADIRSRSAQLLAADADVGSKLTATAGEVGNLIFNEEPIPRPKREDQRRRLEGITRSAARTHRSRPPRRGQKSAARQAPDHRQDSQRGRIATALAMGHRGRGGTRTGQYL